MKTLKQKERWEWIYTRSRHAHPSCCVLLKWYHICELNQSSSSYACIDKCFGSAWAFWCQLWLWSSLLKNVRRYSWALIDFYGTKVKCELIAHPLTNCLLHSGKHKQVFYSAGSGKDLSTMLKGQSQGLGRREMEFQRRVCVKNYTGLFCLPGLPLVTFSRAQLFQLSQHPSYNCVVVKHPVLFTNAL